MRAFKYMGMLLSLALILANVTFAQEPKDSIRSAVHAPQLEKELLEMEVDDQNVANLFTDTLAQHPNDKVAVIAAGKKMNSVYNRNTVALKKIIHRYGWPGTNLVGRKGAEAAFLIVQHSNDTLFQRACLSLLRNAYERGQAPGEALALLTDRVLVREGKPQLYGTQANIIDGKITLDAISDSANVDARRAKLGLPPLAKYTQELKQFYLKHK